MNKMNKILAILALFIIGCVKSEKEILPCNLQIDDGISYTDGKVFKGTCNILYEGEYLWKTLTYKRGKLHKEIGYYVPEGSIEYIGYRDRDGKIHGDFQRFFKNGDIEIEGTFSRSYYTGDWKYYNEAGEMYRKMVYDKAGMVLDSITY